MGRKVERAEAVQQVNKTLTLRADNLQSDVDRLSSLLEKASASEQIRKSLTQEEVRKMKTMATKVAQNDKRLSRRNRELEAEVANLEKQLQVHKGYKQQAAKSREMERTITSMTEELSGAKASASDNMVNALVERKKVLEKEAVFLKAQVKKYSEAARDRNTKARRVIDLEEELSNVSQPFLNMSRSVTGLNKDIEGMIGRLNNELTDEVSQLHKHMESATLKVRETEQLNMKVRQYEDLLKEQQVIMQHEKTVLLDAQMAEQAAEEAAAAETAAAIEQARLVAEAEQAAAAQAAAQAAMEVAAAMEAADKAEAEAEAEALAATQVDETPADNADAEVEALPLPLPSRDEAGDDMIPAPTVEAVPPLSESEPPSNHEENQPLAAS